MGSWQEVEIEGDCYCPNCKGIMVIIPVGYRVIAFCPKCEKYFWDTSEFPPIWKSKNKEVTK